MDKTIESRAKWQLDHILVKYHDMDINQIIELTEHMHHLATKLHMFATIKEPQPTTKDKDPTNN